MGELLAQKREPLRSRQNAEKRLHCGRTKQDGRAQREAWGTQAMKTKKVKKSADQPAMAIHMSHKDGKHHVVGIGNLRVVIVREGKFFCAQGLEIDYASYGTSVEEAKASFSSGLRGTIMHNIRFFGTIEKLLVPAPSQVWQEVLTDGSAIKNRFFQVSSIKKKDLHADLPYDGIDFLVRGKEGPQNEELMPAGS